jgi:hypothetical protein
VEITCTGVTFTYLEFPAGVTASSEETVTVDGETVHSGTFTITPPGGESFIPLSIVGNATVVATFVWTSSDRPAPVPGGDEESVECGDTTGGTTGGDTTGGDTTGGDTTGGGTTGGGTTGGGTGGGGGTTGTGGAIGNTTGGTPGSETGGELPFTGLPIWVPVLLAAGLLGGGVFLLRRRRDDVS